MFKVIAYIKGDPLVTEKYHTISAALDAGREQLKMGRLVEVVDMDKSNEEDCK